MTGIGAIVGSNAASAPANSSGPFFLATVTTVNPLTITTDGSTTPVPAQSATDQPYVAGTRVLCSKQGVAVFIFGVASPAPTYWTGQAASGDAASTVSGWGPITTAPTVNSTDDADNDTFLPVSGGIRIYTPGRYIVEAGISLSGGAANARFGIGLYTTASGTSAPGGGSGTAPMNGYSLGPIAATTGSYYTLTRPFTVFSTTEVRVAWYAQTTTSHTATLQTLTAMKVG